MSLIWKNVMAVVFDFDGVLTDNRVWVFEDGREAVCCNRADGLAFDEFKRRNFPVYLLSTEKNPVVSARAKKLGVPVIQGSSDKAKSMRDLISSEGWTPEHVLFVGNDLNDLPAFEICGFRVAVADAHPLLKAAAGHVLNTPGGGGVAREITQLLFNHGSAQSSA